MSSSKRARVICMRSRYTSSLCCPRSGATVRMPPGVAEKSVSADRFSARGNDRASMHRLRRRDRRIGEGQSADSIARGRQVSLANVARRQDRLGLQRSCVLPSCASLRFAAQGEHRARLRCRPGSGGSATVLRRPGGRVRIPAGLYALRGHGTHGQSDDDDFAR